MYYDDFLKLLKADDINSTYLFMGDEEYLMDECIALVKKSYVSESLEALNYAVLDGKNTTFDNLVNTCETLPFMAPKKIVILKDMAQLFDKENNDLKDLYDYLDNLGNHLCLILVDSSNELKKTTKIYKYYNKNNKVVEFAKLKGKELSQWIERITKKNKVNISFSDINYFIQHSTYLSRNVNSTLYDLENELTKVMSYSKNGEIVKDDIDLVMIKSLDNNIFDLLSAINRGDIDSSLSIFNEIFLLNEPIQKILFMISRQMRLMLGYNIYRSKGYTDGEIIEKMQIKPYEYQKISTQARGFSIKELEENLNLLLDVDKKLKTTPTDEKIEMEILLIRLSKKL